MSKKLKTLHDLLVEQVRDIYYAEKQILKALPKMAKKASDPELVNALEKHYSETETHISRLEKVFDHLELTPRGKTCPAIDGIIEEGKELLGEEAEPEVMDAAIIGAAQKVEHYEMATYGCIRTYARLCGYDKIQDLLQKTLDEEGETDKKLTMLADSINVEALEPEPGEE